MERKYAATLAGGLARRVRYRAARAAGQERAKVKSGVGRCFASKFFRSVYCLPLHLPAHPPGGCKDLSSFGKQPGVKEK